MLTNCTSGTADLWRASALAPLVDAAAFSDPEGILKPEPAFYELLLARLGVEPAACAYIGDGKDNELGGAERVGLMPILYAPHGANGSWPGPTIRSLDEAPQRLRAMRG